MSRLIDADVLKAIYDPSSYEGHGPNENWDNVVSTFEEIRTDIDDQPTVDAVPLDKIINVSLFDEEHEEWSNKEMTVREYLYMYTDFKEDE